MIRKALLPLLFSLLLPAAAGAAEFPARGDAKRGELLFKANCATCHGLDAKGSDFWRKASHGKSLGELPDLRDSAFMAQRSDVQLRRAIRKGMGGNGWIPGHAFGDSLSSLEVWDLVQWLREGNFSIAQFFPEAAKFTAKDFELDEHGVKRLEETLGLKLSKERKTVVVITAYQGKTEKNRFVKLVPWTPVQLDLLKADDRLGFLVFTELELPGEKQKLKVPAGLAVGKDGKLKKVLVRLDDAKKRAEHEKALNAFVGQGEKKLGKLKAPKGLKNGAAYEKILTDELGRTAEAVVMFDKFERDRTAFDR